MGIYKYYFSRIIIKRKLSINKFYCEGKNDISSFNSETIFGNDGILKDNIENLLKNPFFEAIRHEVTLPFYSEIDQIYNLACPASPIHYQKDPSQTTKTCVHGAINMLGLAKRTGAKIFQASTSEIYGDPEVHPQNETYLSLIHI